MRGHRTDGVYRRCPDNDASEDRGVREMTDEEEEQEAAQAVRDRAELICELARDRQMEEAYQKQQGE
jgi:hypothetical protein